MAVKMAYGMAEATKALTKNDKAVHKLMDKFLSHLDALFSFSKFNIPSKIMKRIAEKEPNAITKAKMMQLAEASMKKTNMEEYEKYKKQYEEYLVKMQKKRREEKERLKNAPLTSASSGLEKVADILEAFVLKVNFNLKKVATYLYNQHHKVK